MTTGVPINWIGMKSVRSVFSNLGVIMTEIVWQRQLIFYKFG